MRESRIYLKFLKENLLILIVVPIIISLITLATLNTLNLLNSYSYSRQFEVAHSNEDAQVISMETENLVSKLRSSQLQPQLIGKSSVKISVVKSAPFMFVVSTSSNQETEDLTAVSNTLVSFSHSQGLAISEVGTPTFNRNSYFVRYLFSSIVVGEVLAILISLIRHYFRYN
jgi:hypothetical protein